ncbi:hypothetical protein BJY16_007374 [Actinoplanes octamycinicus]|uniref:Uncharacterized protein n=1 Tax=Actinoplanes octamycinicus TaxID=135948 RepID=A0A7W7H4K8_9ACTN|nr:hypothetical protein [Actinoplanes octamycinicus]MBB4743915.1 hypothetical protein [Actinoplanes octamycinicus]GIE58541.1 hypothetical protein Aoc01nite_39430 [Actinoplanes octamycinicus]
MLNVDELHSTLEMVTPGQRVAFAAACLEALVDQFGSTAPGADRIPRDIVARSVDLCWHSVPHPLADLRQNEDLHSQAEAILYDDEDGLLSAGTHVLTAVCYGLRCAELRTSECGVLVANYYYEIADYVIIHRQPGLSESEILETPVVSSVLKSIENLAGEVAVIDASNAEMVSSFRERAIASRDFRTA